MKLYYSPGACSMAAHISLIEAGIKCEYVKVDLRAHTYSGGNFYEVNPKGYVPALEITPGEVLTESSVILQWIADQKPETNLIPKFGTLERYRCMEWLAFTSSEVHKGFSPMWNPSITEDAKRSLIDRLATRFDFLSTPLKTKPFLMGNQFTVADSYLFTVLSWASVLKVDLSKWPALLGYLERISIRPSVQQALKEGQK